MYVVIFNELVLARRLNEITFPASRSPTSIRAAGVRRPRCRTTLRSLHLLQRRRGLERFLHKYNNITFDFAKAVPNRKEWESPPVAAARRKVPDRHHRHVSGREPVHRPFPDSQRPAGDNLQVLVVYKSAHKNERVNDKDALLKNLHNTCAGAASSMSAGRNSRSIGHLRKYDDTCPSTPLVDTNQNRLVRAAEGKVFWGEERSRVLRSALAHGRALGTDSANPNAEKEPSWRGDRSPRGHLQVVDHPALYERRR